MSTGCALKQGNVKVQGMGVFFLVMPYDMAPYWVDSKWFIEPQALES